MHEVKPMHATDPITSSHLRVVSGDWRGDGLARSCALDFARQMGFEGASKNDFFLASLQGLNWG